MAKTTRQTNLETLLSTMLAQAREMNAPVLELEELLKTSYDHLVFAVLSPRSRDRETIKAFRELRKRAGDFREMDGLGLNEIQESIRNIGLWKQKAGRLKKIAGELKDREVPQDLEELKKLPGIGDKVASVILADCFGKQEIAVDIHVFRISNRLGLIEAENPKTAKEQLKKVFPRKLWGKINIHMVAFGQTVCLPKNPKCKECGIRKGCRFGRKLGKKGKE